MKCKKCGYELKENFKCCPVCSEINELYNETYAQKNENKGLSIYLTIFYITMLFGILNLKFGFFYFLISLITIVTAYIKYPKNKTVKVLFILFIFFLIFLMVYLTYSLATCVVETCN